MNTGTNEQNIKTEPGVLVVTNEQYEKMKADGIDDETLLPPGSYKLRRRERTATKEELHPSNTKVDVMIQIDLDVLNYFKQRRCCADAADYKIQINRELRAIMEREQHSKITDVAASLLQNKDFIEALAAELKKIA